MYRSKSFFTPKLQCSYIMVLVDNAQFASVHSQYSLREISLSGGNYFRGKFYGEWAIFRGWQLSSGAIFRGAIIQGKIVRGAITQGGNFPRGQSSRHLLVRGVLQHGTKNIEREYLYISTIWKDQNSWKLLRRRLSFVSLSSFCRNNAFI